MQVFPVEVVNDTGAVVVVRDCDDFCSSSPLAFNLGPGSSTVVNRAAGEHKQFSITTASGGHIGCVDLYFKGPQPNARVLVSQAGTCPADPRPLWQTLGLVAALLVAVSLPFLALRRRR